MFYKSDTQPYCRCCGEPIRKWTTDFSFGRDMTQSYNNPANCSGEKPKTREEAQRYVNQQITSHRRWRSDYIQQVSVWDGETYYDGTFCKVKCAEAFGRMAAEAYPQLETQRAYDARKKRETQ